MYYLGLRTYTFPREQSFSSDTLSSKVYDAVVARSLANGTTTASYFATHHIPAAVTLVKKMQSRRQRGFVGVVCMDQNVPTDMMVADAAKHTRDFMQLVESTTSDDDSLVQPIVTPRFAVSCTADMLEVCKPR